MSCDETPMAEPIRATDGDETPMAEPTRIPNDDEAPAAAPNLVEGGGEAPANRKASELAKLLCDMGRVAVAFSGGADSTLLLDTAARIDGIDVVAIMADTPFTPRSEVAFARDFCARRSIPFLRLEVDTLADPAVTANTPERCYICKRLLFDAILKTAKECGDFTVVDGTNADDLNDLRPGLKALAESGVISPLERVGLSKAEIYALSREADLPTKDKPANACLATRIPFGDSITADKLSMIERAEEFLHGRGLKRVRVRVHGSLARIETDPADIPALAAQLRQDVTAQLHGCGFTHVTLDLDGYRTGGATQPL